MLAMNDIVSRHCVSKSSGILKLWRIADLRVREPDQKLMRRGPTGETTATDGVCGATRVDVLSSLCLISVFSTVADNSDLIR